MTRFSGQAVVIRGGSNGIGLATAERIAAEGGRVLITGRNLERLAAAPDASAAQSAKIQEMMRKMAPLRRMGTLAEASTEASFVTGADCPVDGGEAQLQRGR